jgi:hypothetical protein
MSATMVPGNHAGDVHMNAVLPILIIVALMLALDLAAMRSGTDSRDPFDRDRLR